MYSAPCLRGIGPPFVCVSRRELTFPLPTSLWPGQARHMFLPSPPLFFLLRSLQHPQTPPPPRHLLPVDFRLLLSSQPGHVGSAQPTPNDVITVPALPRVGVIIVGPAPAAALSSPPGWLSNLVLCPTAAAAAAHPPHKLPTVPISPSIGRRTPGRCQSPSEGGRSRCIYAAWPEEHQQHTRTAIQPPSNLAPCPGFWPGLLSLA